jgi:hypothetical protein
MAGSSSKGSRSGSAQKVSGLHLCICKSDKFTCRQTHREGFRRQVHVQTDTPRGNDNDRAYACVLLRAVPQNHPRDVAHAWCRVDMGCGLTRCMSRQGVTSAERPTERTVHMHSHTCMQAICEKRAPTTHVHPSSLPVHSTRSLASSPTNTMFNSIA